MTELRSGVYRHYKGDHYQLIGVGEHTETHEPMVVYVALHARPGPRIRIRPLNGAEGFLTPVELKGKTVPRFAWIGNEIPTERWDADLQQQTVS
jgi:hypothetical protein